MSPSLWGVHAANGGDNVASEVLELGISHVTLLHLEAGFAREIHDGIDGILLLRFYLPHWAAVDPVKWAQRCAEEARRDRGGWSLLGLPRVHFTPANEMNLANEGGGESPEWYDSINDWLLLWAQEFRRITDCSINRLHWPALAYGHNELEYGYERCARSLRQYGWLDSHPYWFQRDQVQDPWHGHRFTLDHNATGKRIFLSEAGNFDVTRSSTPDECVEWFQSLYQFKYLGGATPFIRADPTGQHQSNDWSRNPALIDRIKRQEKRTATGAAPPPQPPQEEPMSDDLQQYATWSLARIANEEDPLDLAAFREHVQALGGDPASLAAYGVPMTGNLPFDAAALAGHLEAVQNLLRPIVAVAGRVDAAKELLRPFL